ncbi:hypothetical protein IWW55_000663 [Coemansia sp. RSA 2706]|nr:hypothetical protein IWW55_000663 [Coemansia sp. RSA 2706]
MNGIRNLVNLQMDEDGDDDVRAYMSQFDAMLLEINTNDLTLDMDSASLQTHWQRVVIVLEMTLQLPHIEEAVMNVFVTIARNVATLRRIATNVTTMNVVTTEVRRTAMVEVRAVEGAVNCRRRSSSN